MKQILFTATLIVASYCIQAQKNAQWRGPDRNGIYPETSLLKSWPANGPKLLWHFEGLGEGFASATVTQKYIYTAGCINGKGYIFCLDHTGKQQWKITYGDEWVESWNGTRSTPLYHEGKVYMLSPYGKLVCLGGEHGNLIWSVDMAAIYGAQVITWGITENLLIDGEKLFCITGGPKNNVVALHKDTGKLIWSSPGNGGKSAYNSPIIVNLSGRKLLIAITETSILGLDAGTGKKLWSQEFINQYAVHANAAIFRDGLLYCTTGYGTGGIQLRLSPDGSKATLAWRNATLDPKTGGAVLLNDRIYGFGDKNRGFHVIDWKTGKEAGSEKLNQKGGAVIAADGMLYTYDEAGEVALLQPTATGVRKVSSFKVPYGADQHWAHPVIDDGKLYIRHGTSLMVYDIKNR